MLKVLIISNTNENSPSIRYRLLYPLQFLGIEYKLLSFFSVKTDSILNTNNQFKKIVYSFEDAFRFIIKIYKEIFFYDIIIVKNYFFPIGEEKLEKIFSYLLKDKYIIYDIDDAIYLNQSRKQNKIFACLRNANKKVEFWVNRANTICIPNEVIKEDLIKNYRIDTNKLIQFLSCPYREQYFRNLNEVKTEKNNYDGEVRFIWLGSPHTQANLNVFNKFIRILPEVFPKLKVIFMGTSQEFSLFRDLEYVEFKDWSIENEKIEMRKAHFGLNPLHDREFEKRKSAFKVIQYYRAGIIPIVANVGINQQLVNRYGGYCLSDNLDELKDFLNEVIKAGIDKNIEIYEKTMDLSVECNSQILNLILQNRRGMEK